MKKERNILKKQTSMKVILNGGKFELDDATIPFQIGFDESIAEKKPAYVLVMDVTRNPFDERGKRLNYDSYSERKLFKLEPVQYLQLKKPGIHHLIFILFEKLNDNDKKFLLEKNNRTSYENSLSFDSIEQAGVLMEEISYCEMTISVPEEFFAIKPKTGIKKSIWRWVNLWHSFDPVDQCEYRKRVIFAFTTQPIFWLIGFIARFILVTLWTAFFIIFKTIALIFGYQPVKFIPYKKKVWYEFLICYSKAGFDVLSPGDWVYRNFSGNLEEGYHPYKTLSVGKKRMHVPITLAEVITYLSFFYAYTIMILAYFYADLSVGYSLLLLFASIIPSLIISSLAISQTLPTLKRDKKWGEKWDSCYVKAHELKKKVFVWIFSVLAGVSLLSFMITKIPWAKIFELGIKVIIPLVVFVLVVVALYPLLTFLDKKVQKMKKSAKSTKIVQKDKYRLLEEKRKEWLLASFNINNLPKKVDLDSMPESSSSVHKFVVRFWQTKAKVCKPYAK